MIDFNNFIKRNVVLVVIVGLIMGYFAFYSFRTLNTKTDNLQKNNSEHSRINLTKQNCGLVANRYSHRGVLMLTMDDSTKIWIPHSRNYLYDPFYLHDFVIENDSICNVGDTLHIYRGREKYFFVVDQSINSPD